MSDDRKKPGWAFWVTVVLVVLVIYPLSSGPARWVLAKCGDSGWPAKTYVAVYGPLYKALSLGPVWLFDSAVKYRFWWSSLALDQDR